MSETLKTSDVKCVLFTAFPSRITRCKTKDKELANKLWLERACGSVSLAREEPGGGQAADDDDVAKC